MKKKVLLFLAEGFEEIEAIAPIDILRRADIIVQTVSISDSLNVKGSHGIVVKADVLFKDVDFSNTKMLILPGGMPGTSNLNEHSELKVKLTEFDEDGKYIAAICAAPSVLGQLGMLKGKRAVCYPGWEEKLKGAYTSEHRIEIDNNIITARGAGVAIEFALALVSILKSKSLAKELSDKMIY